jgi:hypothetical protein
MRTRFELADIINDHAHKLVASGNLTSYQISTLRTIAACRTAVMGGHEEVCTCCGTTRYSYNSCGNRHCPKCLATKQAFWIDDLMQTTLSVKHFHIVFTIPHELNKICIWNHRLFYSLMFDAVWQTLRTFGYTHFGVELGAICVLHTWGQNLSFHPHIHCIVAAAGYSIKGQWKNIGDNGSFLFPHKPLWKTYKGKMLDSLKRKLIKHSHLEGFNHLLQQAWNKKWVVNIEPAMASAEHVIQYLGQYTHRVAITNQRIVNVNGNKVTFMAKDYRNSSYVKPITIDAVEFLRRFTLHILPRRFVKIRRYGIYNHTVKRNLSLKFVPSPSIEIVASTNRSESTTKETRTERFKRLTGFDAAICPFCKKGTMVVVKTLPRIRSPAVLTALFGNAL